MSCGTKIDSYDRYEIARKLEREGEYRIAQDVMNDRCLDSWDLRKAEVALERQGFSRNWDYSEHSCHCETEDQ